jgi:aminoglycoside 3-N-acetyltransferase
MSEKDILTKNSLPLTRDTLAKQFRAGGVCAGMNVMVHSSLSSLGWVCGGSIAVIQALMDVITHKGLLLMPSHTSSNSDPEYWCNPPVPESWWDAIRENMPAFHPDYSPSEYMGLIADSFRTYPGVMRSNHPQLSFCAWGEKAEEALVSQTLDHGMGEHSPLHYLYNSDGYVLLIGVGYDKNTSMHLAEELSGCRSERKCGAAVFENGIRIWKEYHEAEYDEERFLEIGSGFETKFDIASFRVGSAKCRLMNQKELVNYSRDWFLSQKAQKNSNET